VRARLTDEVNRPPARPTGESFRSWDRGGFERRMAAAKLAVPET
jgi:hypothetical protein